MDEQEQAGGKLMERVEMHQAYVWDCNQCGRENFERAIEFDGPQEEKDEMLRQMGAIDEWQSEADLPDGVGIGLQMAPDKVTCKHCQAVFETEREEAQE